MAYDKQLTKKSDDLSEWYNKVVLAAELADYGPAKGTMIFRPYGYGIWELAQKELDVLIQAKGVENAYFPLFIPESLLKKEEAHIEGFSPELAVVTIGGGEELDERLVIRPTSETIMYDAYSRWIQSWRDLPMMINQWNNVVRWEKRTYLFLRTTEFLWQEGHTAHATAQEAQDMQRWAIDTYAKIYREVYAVPGYVGRKSETEKFAGASSSMTYESLMPEGKALQSSTSHDLGQNFSKAFGIKFQASDGTEQFVWQTSWGLSTRSIGGLLMTHGDDKGLVLPPRLAPIQVVVIPVKPEGAAMEYAHQVTDKLAQAGFRVKLDDCQGESFGFKLNKWELKGVPLRFEIGDKEAADKAVTVVRRDNSEKHTRSLDIDQIQRLLDEIQAGLLEKAETFLKANTHEVDTYDQFKDIMASKKGFIRAFWCEEADCEARIKADTKAKTSCLPLDAQEESGKCVACGKPAQYRWLFAQAY